MTTRRSSSRGVALVVAGLFLASCTTSPFTGEREVSKTATGATVGAAAGAALGALTGRDRAKRAAIGAGIGALLGGAVGAYMDAQEAKLRQQLQGTGVSITRAGNELLLNMPGNVTFPTDSADIRSNFFPVLSSVALVLEEYEKTIIEITGHTDVTGAPMYNQELSERRSASVGHYLEAQGLRPVRIVTKGLGPRMPIARNDTATGRQQNRRVELRLIPLTASARSPVFLGNILGNLREFSARVGVSVSFGPFTQVRFRG